MIEVSVLLLPGCYLFHHPQSAVVEAKDAAWYICMVT